MHIHTSTDVNDVGAATSLVCGNGSQLAASVGTETSNHTTSQWKGGVKVLTPCQKLQPCNSHNRLMDPGRIVPL